MKREKADEKIRGPMFPRLHVSDTEKGGPRAPPRNKMALYEQFSIPSQRFNAGLLPLNPNNATSVVPPASSSRGIGDEKGTFFPLHLPHSKRPAEKSCSGYSDFSIPSTNVQKKKLDEEDFTVPVYDHSMKGQDPNKKHYAADNCPNHSDILMKVQNGCKELKKTSLTGPNLRHKSGSKNEDNLRKLDVDREKSVKAVQNTLHREKIEGQSKQVDTSPAQQHGQCLANNIKGLQTAGTNLQHESRVKSHLDISRCRNASDESRRCMDNGHSSIPRRSLCSDGRGNHDDVLETSMVDSVTLLDVSPDDVVGVIGQKHFWKARRALVNQQRVFAVQVFELHRLIKVQKLIAGSPHLLIEDGVFLGKPVKGSSPKKLPLECSPKPTTHILMQKDDSEDPSHKMECSAENAVGKASLCLVQNTCQPPSNGQFSGNALPKTPLAANTAMDLWSFHQPSRHQWLIPVMSPSEGLVYKPYHGPGLMSPICGGCGTPGLMEVMGNFTNPAYGMLPPTPHNHYQGSGFPPAGPVVGNSYFPQYGMPIVNPTMSGSVVEQMNHLGGLAAHSQLGPLSGDGPNSKLQHQGSCEGSSQKNGASSVVLKRHAYASKGSELQVSTASSPSQGARGIGRDYISEGRNALPLFPPCLAVSTSDATPETRDTDQPSRVIKVVPRNARTASESAARIFQSIQEGRKQLDSV